MFSGGDSSGEGMNSLHQFGNFRQLAAGAQASQIDWASIAQQWIQMRDSSCQNLGALSLPIPLPPAPPPPNITNNYIEQPVVAKKTAYEEKGEADMDMDDDEDNAEQKLARTSELARSVDTIEPAVVMPSQWFLSQPTNIQPDIGQGVDLTGNLQQQQTQPPGVALWNIWPPRVNVPPPPPTLHTPIANPTAHIPSLMKINVPNPNVLKTQTTDSSSVAFEPAESAVMATMDAAKRKILPAWIREGLEKMEREKQKQLERQQSKDGDTINPHNCATELTVKNNMKTIMDSDSSGNEEDVGNRSDGINNSMSKVKGKDNVKPIIAAAVATTASDESDIDAAEQRNIGKSYEQKLADLMIVVRRTLTELLLEVTNEEISNVAHEAIKSRKSKASSAQVIRKSALSSIAGKLGLAAYDDSSSGDSSGTDNDHNDNENTEDSEEEIMASIRMKRRAFAKVSEELEERIATSATREEQKLKYYAQIEQQQQRQDEEREHKQSQYKDHDRRRSDHHHHHHEGSSSHRHGTLATTTTTTTMAMTTTTTMAASTASGKGYEREFGETTESKLQHSNGKRQKDRSSHRKERTTRFSDNKDTKISSMSATTTYMQSHMKPSVSNTPPMVAGLTTSAHFPISGNGSSSSSHVGTKLASGAGLSSMLKVAEATLEKISKRKTAATSTSASSSAALVATTSAAVAATAGNKQRHRKRSRRGRRSSDDDDSSDTDTDSSSSSSRNSKYSRASSSKVSSSSHKRRRRSKRSSSSRRKHYRKHSTRHRHTRSRTRSRSRSRSSYNTTLSRHRR